MRKRDELDGVPGSCLAKAADDEWVFVLRAQDMSAPMAIRSWLEWNRRTLSPEKIAHAEQCIREMEAWPTRKLPD
jgi:hypothetical protein